MLHNPTFWILLIVGVLIIYGIWTQGNKKWKVKIVVDETGVRSHEGLPPARVARIVEFFEKTISIESKCVVQARTEPNGHLRTRISGSIDEGTKQQIRNFLMTVL